jgi:hypothetical protein
MAKTLRQIFIAALIAKGERQVKETHKFVVFTKATGGYYYIGRSGSLRFGSTVANSIPASDRFKKELVDGIVVKVS